MAYGTFKTVEEVATKFDIEVAKKTAFMGQVALEIPALLFEMMVESLNDNMSFVNEVTICERIISPILTIVSRNHEPLGVWSHVLYNVDEKAGLVGEPDYLIAPRTKYGGMARPSLCVIEAKRDDFELGWAQALAEMVASASSGAALCYGVVTTGKLWEFGRLTDGVFTVDTVGASALENLQKTFGALNWLFGEVAKQYDFSSPILPEKKGQCVKPAAATSPTNSGPPAPCPVPMDRSKNTITMMPTPANPPRAVPPRQRYSVISCRKTTTRRSTTAPILTNTAYWLSISCPRPGPARPASSRPRLNPYGEKPCRKKTRIAVIEGDLETENDAARIRAHGVPAIQITTGSACHLDAHMVHNALHRLDLAEFELLFIENVGNLVCPASFDLGQHYNVVLLSVTEGDDKPAKYPVMFRGTDLMVLTKTDLLPYLDDFDPERAEDNLRGLANTAPVIRLSTRARDGESDGMAAWIDWLLAAREKVHFSRGS